MSAESVASVPCGEHHCVTCGDDGVPMTVLALEGEPGVALCADDDGERSQVEVTLVEPIGAGDRVLVHAGVALVALQEAQA